MVEGFIVIIISLLFWGKVSKDTLDNKPKLDVVRTIVYFSLSVIVAIIYYKSSQVEISENRIDIRKFVNTTNQNGESSDSASITINYRMTLDNANYMASFQSFNPFGGVDVLIKNNRTYSNISIDSSKIRGIYELLYTCFDDSLLNKEIPNNGLLSGMVERYKEELFTFRPKMQEIHNSLFSPYSVITREDSVELMDALTYILKDLKLLYSIVYIPPKQKTFLPIDIQKSNEKHYVKGDDERCSFAVKSRIFLEEFIDSIWLEMGIEKDRRRKEFDSHNITAYSYFVGASSIPGEYDSIDTLSFLKLTSTDSLFNHIDYFTASDMSQRVFKITLPSDLPLNRLAIYFDEPINISDVNPDPDYIGMNQIVYTDKNKLELLRNSSLMFHAKLPTYENKQLLRSLILTTILTAVFSLFCTNLYLCGRGLARKILKERILTSEEKEKYKKRIAVYEWTVLAIVILIFAIPLYMYYKYLSNDSLLLKSDNVVPVFVYSAIIIIVIVLAINFWKMKLIPKSENKEKEKNKTNDAENLHSK